MSLTVFMATNGMVFFLNLVPTIPSAPLYQPYGSMLLWVLLFLAPLSCCERIDLKLMHQESLPLPSENDHLHSLEDL
ncbi:hypothetical protein DM01DRAFT_34981 [Hesseltinella vesiculosa]|uniref:Uncharacterized protein n=1 Tax=Hesseltinella vesiculosa TaxID=101127 RepID=A0A1X2GEA0_9FUNG|nr:hypothetical protein DM01DRAFT_34981 [Hesseltinella vesiculosa]